MGGVFSEDSEMEGDEAVTDIPCEKRIRKESSLEVFFRSIKQRISTADGVSDSVVSITRNLHKEGVGEAI